MKRIKISKNIIICVNSCKMINHKSSYMMIEGWAFAKKSSLPVEIEVLEVNRENIAIKRYGINNLQNRYGKNEGTSNSGFTIEIRNINNLINKNQIQLKFTDFTNNESLIYLLDIKGIVQIKNNMIEKKDVLDSVSQILGKKKKKSKDNIDTKIENIGVNIIGYSRAEIGVGEACRSIAKALDASKINFGIKDACLGNFCRKKDDRWAHKEINEPLYDVNVIHINAEEIGTVYKFLKKKFWSERYNIGYWAWELPDFPDEWMDKFKYVNEVWAGSKFTVESIRAKSPVPVVHMPYCINLDKISKKTRDDFKLPNEAFLFLTMYDVNSYQARKNPVGAIEAFKNVFEPNDMSVGLLIKINNALMKPWEIVNFKKIIYGYKNIYFITETLSREDVNALINLSDCFISLHRSEGFGLVMAEAMCLGVPVIGTNWSGNIDFMNYQNSCPVNYELIKIGSDFGPYHRDQIWAEPYIESASYYMKKLISNKEYYNKISSNAKETINRLYSPRIIGSKIKIRLQQLNLFP